MVRTTNGRLDEIEAFAKEHGMAFKCVGLLTMVSVQTEWFIIRKNDNREKACQNVAPGKQKRRCLQRLYSHFQERETGVEPATLSLGS